MLSPIARRLPVMMALIMLLLACRGAQEAAETVADNASPTAAAMEEAERPTMTPAPSATPPPTAVPAATVAPSPSPPPQIERVEEGGIAAYAHQPLAEIVSGSIRSLVAGSHNSLWLVTNETAAQWQEGGVVQQLDSFPGRFLGEDTSNGLLWAATLEGEIMAWDGSAWSAVGPQEGWQPLQNSPAVLYPGQIDAQGRFWLPTNADLRLFDGEQWQIFSPADLGLEDIVDGSTWFGFSLFPAANGELWLGVCHVMPPGPVGGQGVRVYQDGVWRMEAGLPESGCTGAIRGADDGSLWLNVEDSLWHRAGAAGAWASSTPPPPEFGVYANLSPLQIDAQGNAWALAIVCGGAGCGNISTLFQVVDGAWRAVPGWNFATFGSTGLFFDDAGNLWATDGSGLYRIATASPQITGQWAILAAAQSEDGQIWFVANDAAGAPTLFSIAE